MSLSMGISTLQSRPSNKATSGRIPGVADDDDEDDSGVIDCWTLLTLFVSEVDDDEDEDDNNVDWPLLFILFALDVSELLRSDDDDGDGEFPLKIPIKYIIYMNFLLFQFNFKK